ncbi:MAG: HAMP domain-containing sensor histidine kinase [Acidobacteriota bacterium]
MKKNLHHFVFVFSLLSLTLLVIWWSVFIYRSIEERTALQKNILTHELNDIHHRITGDGTIPVIPGGVESDRRFMITERLPSDGSIFIELSDIRPGLFLMVDEQIIKEIDRDEQRKKLMVSGESGLLVLVVLIGIIFLFKFINLEKRSSKEMEEFWGRMSHEIKTPITGIRSFLESLKKGSISEEKLPQFIDLALKQIGKQERLAENILTGSSFKSNIKLKIEEFNVITFLNSYFTEHSLNLTKGEIRFEFDDKEIVPVQCDKYALEVILDNIIDNADKYASGGLRLCVKTERSGREVIICLSDNGPGFNSSSEIIFNAFKYSRNELPDTPHGTGMGLYISRKLARQMNGDIDASSDGNGEGSTFRVILPSGK